MKEKAGIPGFFFDFINTVFIGSSMRTDTLFDEVDEYDTTSAADKEAKAKVNALCASLGFHGVEVSFDSSIDYRCVEIKHTMAKGSKFSELISELRKFNGVDPVVTVLDGELAIEF